MLTAGTLALQVYVAKYGYISRQNNVSALSIPFITSHLQFISGNSNGGYANSLHGSGFISLSQTQGSSNSNNANNQLIITICNQTAIIVHTSNKKIDFIIPSCPITGTYTVNITYGTFSSLNLTFTYNPVPNTLPTITALFPISSNPMIKTIINIAGNNFGSNASILNVYLIQGNIRKY